MQNFLEYEFFTSSEEEQELLISLLSELPFNGFEQTNLRVLGYILSGAVADGEVRCILKENNLSHIHYVVNKIESVNWNHEWEKNFKPVLIADKVGIRAPFHAPLNAEVEIIISPKMSFGTGHHPTTSMMIEMMLDLSYENRVVADIGCGTGILSILALKLGAKKIYSVDNDPMALENAAENAYLNGVTLDLIPAESYLSRIIEPPHVLLANINRSVITENLNHWLSIVNPETKILLSGFLIDDEELIESLAAQHKLVRTTRKEKNGWLALSFVHVA